jgi:alkylated DNA repair dioxygenase AlkB
MASSPMTTQNTLFDLPKVNTISLMDGHILYLPNWLASTDFLAQFVASQDGSFYEHFPKLPEAPQADAQVYYRYFYQYLKTSVLWQQSTISVYGKTVTIPRLNAWYGDPKCSYTYSNTHFSPLPWLPSLLALKQEVSAAVLSHLQADAAQPMNSLLNSALVNCYRDGQDSVAWHSDDEPELGRNPLVVSLSLGETRSFQLRHKFNKNEKKCQITLSSGDLLIMSGSTQHYWQHQVPKTATSVGERISITFRKVKVIVKTSSI